jgi:Family of unknown function (DUF6151)
MLARDDPVRCRCGRIEGAVASAAPLTRVACYCRDCQAYAHALGQANAVLDPFGGTEIVSTIQQHLRFMRGTDQLACMRLSPRGTLRWYARCCDTPIANMAPNPRLSYLGLVHTCLGNGADTLDAAFGSDRVVVNTKHAKGPVATSSFRTLAAFARIVAPVVWARLDGGWKKSPFFQPDGQPIVRPNVVSLEARERAMKAAAEPRA